MSKVPGSMKLMVTLDAATERATPARKAVRPARAPDDRSRPTSGIFTEPEVMLTMRPNFLATIGSIAFWISSTATIMLPTTPSIIFCAVELAEIAERRAGVVVDQDVGLRAGGEQRLLAFRRGDIGHDRDDLGAGRLAQFVRGGVEASLSRPLITTSQPASASAWAQARPSPRLEAQTMALRPAIPRSMP